MIEEMLQVDWYEGFPERIFLFELPIKVISPWNHVFITVSIIHVHRDGKNVTDMVSYISSQI